MSMIFFCSHSIEQVFKISALVAVLCIIALPLDASELKLDKFSNAVRDNFFYTNTSYKKDPVKPVDPQAKCPQIPTSGFVRIINVPTPDPWLFASATISIELLVEDIDVYKIAQGNGNQGYAENPCSIQGKSPFALIQHENIFIRIHGSCQGAGLFKYEIGEVLKVVNAQFLSDAPSKFLFSPCGVMLPSEYEVKTFLASLQKKWRRVGRIFPGARETFKVKFRSKNKVSPNIAKP